MPCVRAFLESPPNVTFQVGVLFLSFYFLEDYGIGYSWINYSLLLSIFVSIPIVAMAKQPSERQGSYQPLA